MKDIRLFSNDDYEYRCVSVGDVVIKKWSFNNDFAFTIAKEFATKLTRMPKKIF